MKSCIYRKSLGCSTGQWCAECTCHGWSGLADELDCENCPDANWDIDQMDDGELLEELALRLLDWENELEKIDAWHLASKDGITKDEEIKVMAEDNAFCRVREIVRKVTNDPKLWAC